MQAFDLDNFMDDNQLLTEGKKKRRRERFKKLLEGAFGVNIFIVVLKLFLVTLILYTNKNVHYLIRTEPWE